VYYDVSAADRLVDAVVVHVMFTSGITRAAITRVRKRWFENILLFMVLSFSYVNLKLDFSFLWIKHYKKLHLGLRR